MKIPPANALTQRPAAETGRAVTKRGQVSTDATRSDEADEMVEGGGAAERDFASVFDEVVSRAERRDQEAHEQSDRRVSRETERAEHDGAARRREEREGGGADNTSGDGRGGGFEHRAALREVTDAAPPAAARSILHVADLERIVSAVRAQLVEGGRHVVTIELRRSALEGLKVKLSSDGAGRVTAEFIAASERVRSQIDARAPELAELLRGRGVNLAALRTSVDAGGSGDGSGPRHDLPQAAAVVARDAAPSPSNLPAADAPTEEAEGDTSNTYRA